MVWGSLLEAWGVLGCFDGPHDGYAKHDGYANS